MWDKILPLLPEFSSAVLSLSDANGHPVSVRCQPRADSAANCFYITAQPLAVRAGAASLLYHKQEAYINKLKSFLLRGTLRITDGEWVFTPSAFIPGIGIGSVVTQIRFLLDGKRNAKQYLEKRGISYPKIDWAAIEASGDKRDL